MDNGKNGKRIRLLTVLLVLNLATSCCIAGYLAASNAGKAQDGIISGQMRTGEKYIIYIGMNDKDTYEQIIPTGEAREMVNAICVNYVDGYTESDAKGGWVDETDTLTQEDTLVYAFYDVTQEQLVSIMDEILVRLNQNAILVEKQEAVYTYYHGK